MRSSSLVSLIILGTLGNLLLPLSSAVVAQGQRPYAPPKKTQPSMEIEGKLQAVQGGMMRILQSNGRPMVFALPQKPTGVSYRGRVEREGLTKGTVVRIQAPLDSSGQFLEPVNHLEIVIPDPNRKPSGNALADRSMSVPGFYRLSQIYPPMPGSPPSLDVRVVGVVQGVVDNWLSLQCGPKTANIEITQNPTIELLTSGLNFARPGDSVTVRGQINPLTNQLAASSVQVTGAKPLGGPKPATPSVGSMKLQIKEKGKAKSTEGEAPEMKLVPEPTPDPAEAPKSEGSPPATEDSPLGKLPSIGTEQPKQDPP